MRGDVVQSLAGAKTKLDAVYEVPFVAHTTMEPVSCTVHVKPDDGEIWVGTQAIARAQAVAAQITGLPPDKIVVHNHLLGSAFGRQLEVDFVAKAVAIAKQVMGQ
jgi:isoquinoline 1-oxidoreductase beta subunit